MWDRHALCFPVPLESSFQVLIVSGACASSLAHHKFKTAVITRGTVMSSIASSASQCSSTVLAIEKVFISACHSVHQVITIHRRLRHHRCRGITSQMRTGFTADGRSSAIPLSELIEALAGLHATLIVSEEGCNLSFASRFHAWRNRSGSA